jgi:hypothetical protein
MRISDVRKNAILRANALGDFVVTLPAIEALRAAYPEAEITPAWPALARGVPGARPHPRRPRGGGARKELLGAAIDN